MPGNLTPERVIGITWLSVMLACCWPPPPNATKFQITRFKIARMGSIFSAVLLFLPLSYSIYLNHHDSTIMIKTICLMIAVLQVIVQTLFCYTQYNRLQRLIEEMKMFCKEARQEERDILQEYVDKCSIFYGGCIIWFYTSACIVALGTLLISQPFPTDAEYPFSVDYPPLRFIVFLHQSFVGIQCAAHICISCIGALLLWFSAARYKILMQELQTATNLSKLIKCVHEHQHIKRYAIEVTLAVRFITLMAVALSASVVILCAITVISKQALTVKVQFSLLSGAGLLEVFMCAWPADHLMNISVDVTQGAYESPWYMQTLDMQKYILYLLVPQRPVTVSVGCIMPTLSLSYYCSFLSNAFSAFTSLRIILMEKDKD